MPYKLQRRNSANTTREGLQDKVYGTDRSVPDMKGDSDNRPRGKKLENNNEMGLNDGCRRMAIEPEGEDTGKRIKECTERRGAISETMERRKRIIGTHIEG